MDHVLQHAIYRFLGLEGKTLLLNRGEPNGNCLSAKAVISVAAPKQVKRRLTQMGYTRQHSFVFFCREGRPYLLLPVDRPESFLAGLRIYAPYRIRGKVLKAFISVLPRITGTTRTRGKALKALVSTLPWTAGTRCLPMRLMIASREALPLETLVTKLTGEKFPVFAWLINSRAQSSKINLQVMRSDGGILGYVKLSLNETASRCVRHEASVLSQLWGSPELRPSIPQVLYQGCWLDGYALFASALPGKSGPLVYTSSHASFLRTLSSIAPVQRPGELLVKETRARWEQSLPSLGSDWTAIGQGTVEKARRLLEGQSVPCGIIHGDFVPENTRIMNDRLFVFDWERSTADVPIVWDIFHFHLEVAYLLRKRVEDIFSIPKSPIGHACWLLYLLDSTRRLCEAEPTRASATRIRYRRRLLAQDLSAVELTMASKRPLSIPNKMSPRMNQ